MNIQDAIKTGLPFKRKCRKDWLVRNKGFNSKTETGYIDDKSMHEFQTESGTVVIINGDGILDDNWEVKSEPLAEIQKSMVDVIDRMGKLLHEISEQL